METMTTTLTEFLLARITEDEANNGCLGEGEYRTCSDRSERIEKECQAKRLIVAYRAHLDEEVRQIALSDPDEANALRMNRFGIDQAMQMLALVYAGHPDYREEWAT